MRIVLLALCALGLQAFAALADEAPPPLRVCADPDDLPFSSSAPGDRGFSLELAQRIADRIGRPMEPVFTPLSRARRAIRGSLLARHCDIMIGLPSNAGFLAPRLVVSAPFLAVGYALVARPSAPAVSLAGLRGLRVAVEFGSVAQDFVAEHPDIAPVTVLSVREGLEALAEHRADAAILWGPAAEFLNRTRMGGAYRITPLDDDRFRYQAGIGFAPGDDTLRGEIDAVVQGMTEEIAALASRCGLVALSPGNWTASRATINASPGKAMPVGEGLAPDPALAESGRSIVNSACFRCHGHDADSSADGRNLRRLRQRYGPKMDEAFYAAVENGRPSKGMPAWKETYTAEEMRRILSFLHTVQQEP